MARLYTEEHVPVEIICARTQDGILHSGAFIRPVRQRQAAGAAVLWIHGGARNFYYPSYLCIGRCLAAQGHAFVSGNTRGHDVGAVVRWDEERDQPVLGGAAWERFDDSALDIAAWIARIVDLGYPHVVLVGHSMGGWKVAHYQAASRDARVCGLVIASTPVLPPDPLLRHPLELTELAERTVAEGHGDSLLPPERLGHHQSAAAFLRLREFNLDLYGVASAQALLARVGCPVLAWFGTAADEAHIGSSAEFERARRSLPPTTQLDAHLFKGANHMYNGHEDDVADYLGRWIDGLEPAGPSLAGPSSEP